MVTLEELTAAKAAAKQRFGQLEGVLGFAIGEDSVHIYVMDESVITQLPCDIDGIRIEPVVTGPIIAAE
jgi:hypothetical protein